jgi:CDP-glucose 4,6-dehydratase
LGTVNVLEAVRANPSVRVCQVITSDKCYANREWVYAYREEDPLGGRDPYSSSKACADLIATSYRESYFADSAVSLATVRAGNVVGGGDWAEDRIFPDLVRAVQVGKPLRLRNPHAIRPWQHVLEPLRGYLTLAVRQVNDPATFAGAWNFGPQSTGNRTVAELVESATRVWGAGTWTTARHRGAADDLHEAKFLKLDCTKAHSLLPWSPSLDFQETVEKTVHWYREAMGGVPADVVTEQQIAAYECRFGVHARPPKFAVAT